MRVLLLGGTGAMGNHLAGLLQRSGADVAVTSRSRNGKSGGIDYINGNARDLEFLKDVLRQRWDCIVDFMVYSTELFADRAELFLSVTPQYVFLSSARVFAESETPIHEDSPRLLDVSTDKTFLSTDEYALSKAREENILFASRNTNWTIIRPYITYSEERLQLGHLEKEQWLYRALKGRSIVFSKDVCSRLTTLTYGLDVAKAMAAIIGNPKAIGQAFNITVGEPICWGDVLDLYLDAIQTHTGMRPKVLLQDLPDSCAWYPAKYQITHDRMHDRVFDPSKISAFIDVNSFVQPRDGLKMCLDRFFQMKKFLDIDWKCEALKDRATNEKAGYGEIANLRENVKYVLYRHRLMKT